MKQHSHRKKSSPKSQSSRTKRVAPDPAQHLAARLQQQLDKLPLDPLARASGFRRRQPKKLTPRLFVQAACLLVTLGSVSYRRWAGLIGILGGCTLTKQSLFERMSPRAVGFLQAVLGSLLGTLASSPTSVSAALQGFGRVLVQDSTALQLPENWPASSPGPAMKRARRAPCSRFKPATICFRKALSIFP